MAIHSPTPSPDITAISYTDGNAKSPVSFDEDHKKVALWLLSFQSDIDSSSQVSRQSTFWALVPIALNYVPAVWQST